jgi:hypothetical protein
MKRTTPIFARMPMAGAMLAGKTYSAHSGQKAPSTDGPSISPAMISPITGGWLRNRRIEPPMSRATKQITASASSTCASVLP